MRGVNTIQIGDIVRTSYGTGPYEICSVSGPFTSPSYLQSLNLGEKAPASPPHFSYTCRLAHDTKKRKADYYLNGYDGVTHCSVFNNDRLFVEREEILLTIVTLM